MATSITATMKTMTTQLKQKTYAISVADWWANKDDFGLSLLIKPVTRNDDSLLVECEQGQPDSLALPLLCDETRAAAIVEFVRKKYQKHELRIYHGSGKTWKRV